MTEFFPNIEINLTADIKIVSGCRKVYELSPPPTSINLLIKICTLHY